MDVVAMLKREPFYEILKSTIERYYAEVYNTKIKLSEMKRDNFEKLYFYFVPTFMAKLPVTNDMRKFLYSEYNIRGNLLKFLIGKAGVWVITHSHGKAAKRIFYVNSENDCFDNVLVSPCNRSVRFYHFQDGYVDCIVKETYSNDYMKNQLQFRLNCKYPFVPEVLDYGERWYREKIMYGNPLARITDDKEYYSAQDTALQYIGILARDTLNILSLKDYLEIQDNYFSNLILMFPDSKREELNTIANRLFKLFENCELNTPIPIVESHGDFQGGNIWVDKQRNVTIYDWETHGKRSVWYDPATLLWKLHSNPFALDLLKLVREDERVLINDPNSTYSDKEKVIIANILYMENILFYLDDLAQLPMDKSTDSIDEFIVQLKRDIEIRRWHYGQN